MRLWTIAIKLDASPCPHRNAFTLLWQNKRDRPFETASLDIHFKILQLYHLYRFSQHIVKEDGNDVSAGG